MSFNEYWQAEQARGAVAEAIAAMKAGDGAAHQRLYEALKKAALFLPLAVMPEGLQNGDLLVGEKVPLQIKMVKDQQGEPYLPLFSSESTLRHSDPSMSGYLALAFAALVQLALQTRARGIIVDRDGPASAVLQLPVLLSLAQQGGPGQAAAPTQAGQLRVGPPPRVIEHREVLRLTEWLLQAGVRQAFLFGMHHGGQPPVLALGVDFINTPDSERVQAMARALHEVVGPSAVTPLTGPLAMLLARQPGAIRFDLRDQGLPQPTIDGTPASAAPPSPA